MDSSTVKKQAFEVGFDLCGITSAETMTDAAGRLGSWLGAGRHGEMSYMADRPERRYSPDLLLSGARSVVVLGLNYYQSDTTATPLHHGRVARYARGMDYHKVMEKLLKELIRRLERKVDSDTPAEFKWFVDFGPVLEKALAQRAGLGYIGHNSLLINRTYGSWIFLSEITTTLELQPDDTSAAKDGTCGTCRRCIDACPTEAIVEERVIDARRCIAYLTNSRPSMVPQELADKMGDRIYGCDICQEVCPHNVRCSVVTRNRDLLAERGVGEFLNAGAVLALQSQEEFLKLTGGTALVGGTMEGLQRNARIVLENEKAGRRVVMPKFGAGRNKEAR